MMMQFQLEILLFFVLFFFSISTFADNASEPQPQPQTQPQPFDPLPDNTLDRWLQFGLNVALLIIGLLWVFLGLKIFRYVLFMAGFIVLYFVSYELLIIFTVSKGLLVMWAAYVIAAIAGVIGGVLFFIHKPIGKFLFGMLLGMLFSLLLFAASPLQQVGLQPLYQLIIILGVGIIFGFITVKFARYLLIIGTAFNGAFLVGNVIDTEWIQSGVSALLPKMFSDIKAHIDFDLGNWKAYLILLGVFILAIIGGVVQWKFTAAGEDPDRNELERDGERMGLLHSLDS